MNRFARITLAIVLLLLLLWGSAYGWRSYANHKKVQQLMASIPSRTEGAPPSREASAANREAFMTVRKEVATLPEEYQKQFHQGMRDRMMSFTEKRLDAYFAMSKADRIKELDKRIAEEEKGRKERDERRKQRQAQASQTGSSSAGKAGQSSAGNGSGSGGSGNGGSGNGSGNGGPGDGQRGGWGGGGGLAGRLDNTTPEFRAKMAAYRMDMNQRRADLGIPPRPARHSYL